MANMNDVAKLAKVSRGTVSNYINGIKIKESSRIKVEKAVKELGYIPNVAARELKTNTNSNVVFILPTVWNPFFAELTYYLQVLLKKENKKLLLCNSNDDYRAELEYIEMAQQHKVFGIISISYSDITPYLTTGTPYVAIERYYNDTIPYVTSDNKGGGQLAVEELVKRGCRRILHVTREVEGNHAFSERKKGYIIGCENAGIQPIIFSPKTSSNTLHSEIEAFFKRAYQKGETFDGIFCSTDRYASYCLDSLEDLGVSVPEETQVIGFDGAKSYATEQLKISTIVQPVEQIAKEAVDLLVSLVGKQTENNKKVLPVTFLGLKTTQTVSE